MNNHLKNVILVTIFLFTITYCGYYFYQQSTEAQKYKDQVLGLRSNYEKLKNEHEQTLKETKNLRQVSISSNTETSPNNKIGDIMNNYSKKIDGDLSMYYKNLNSGETIEIDEKTEYHMASLYKVILTIHILDLIKARETSFDSPVGKPPITTEKALQKIITESNNDYAVALAEHYGWEAIEKAMVKKLDISFSLNKNLQTNIKNIGALFEEIALSLNISDEDSKYILDLLKDQERISKLPKYLPKNIYSHNKTGELDEYSHDAGIFYTPKANYILIFMSKTKNPGATNEQMAKMSKEVYETLNSN